MVLSEPGGFRQIYLRKDITKALAAVRIQHKYQANLWSRDQTECPAK